MYNGISVTPPRVRSACVVVDVHKQQALHLRFELCLFAINLNKELKSYVI